MSALLKSEARTAVLPDLSRVCAQIAANMTDEGGMSAAMALGSAPGGKDRITDKLMPLADALLSADHLGKYLFQNPGCVIRIKGWVTRVDNINREITTNADGTKKYSYTYDDPFNGASTPIEVLYAKAIGQ